jgi:hypothetical protein
MAISPSLIAFTVILVLYITVGVLAAIGTAYVSKALLPPKFEQVFYAVATGLCESWVCGSSEPGDV